MGAQTVQTASPTSKLVVRWTVALLIAELVGFLPPAVVGTLLGTAQASDAWMVIGLTAAGALEGLALGVAGAWVLARHLPDLDARRWVLGTTLGAAWAWFVGMGGSAAVGRADSPGLVALSLIPLWCSGLLAMGWAQWRVLREVTSGAGRWIWVSAGAWLLGVSIPVAALSAVPEGTSIPVHVAVGSLAALAMGATVGLLTGTTLRTLVARSHRAMMRPDTAPRPATCDS